MTYKVQPLPGYLQQAYSSDPDANISQGLIQSGMSTAPIQSWSQGLARLAQTLAGVYKGNQVRQGYQTQADDYRKQLATALSSKDPTAFLSQSDNPELQQMGLQYQMQKAAREPAVSYSPVSPQEAAQFGLDPHGTYQKSSTGQISVLQAPQKPIVQDGFVIDPNDPAHPQKIAGYLEQKEALAAASRPPTQGPETWSTVTGPDGKALYQVSNRGERKAAVGTGADGFGGTGLENQAWNIVLAATKDPSVASSPSYAAAYQILAQPKVTLDQQTGQMTSIAPDMSKFPKPAYGQQPAAPIAPPGGQAGGPPAPQGAPIVPPQASGGLPAPQPPVSQGPAAGGMPAPQQVAPGVTTQQVMPPKQQPLTEDQAKATGFYDRMQNSEPLIEKYGDAGTSYLQNMYSQVPSIGNSLISDAKQQLNQAQLDWLTAQLRRESGAAIGASEIATAQRQYFPQPGDSKETLAQKAINRKVAMEAMGKATGAKAQSNVQKWGRDAQGNPVPLP